MEQFLAWSDSNLGLISNPHLSWVKFWLGQIVLWVYYWSIDYWVYYSAANMGCILGLSLHLTYISLQDWSDSCLSPTLSLHATWVEFYVGFNSNLGLCLSAQLTWVKY